MKVICPGCKRTYKVDEQRIPADGLKMKCPKCSKAFMVKKKKRPAETAVMFSKSFSKAASQADRQKKTAKPASPSARSGSKEEIDEDMPAVLAGMLGSMGDETDFSSLMDDGEGPEPDSTIVDRREESSGNIEEETDFNGTSAWLDSTPDADFDDAWDDSFGEMDLPTPKPIYDTEVDFRGPLSQPEDEPISEPPVGGAFDLPSSKPIYDTDFDFPSKGNVREDSWLSGGQSPGSEQRADRQTPFADADLPAPATRTDLPAGSAGVDLPAPLRSVDLPGPRQSIDLPAPSPSIDLPGPQQSIDLPAPLPSIDLPGPQQSIDLPAPASGAVNQGIFQSIDLPAPAISGAYGAHHPPGEDQAVKDAPAASAADSMDRTVFQSVDLPAPAVGADPSGFDFRSDQQASVPNIDLSGPFASAGAAAPDLGGAKGASEPSDPFGDIDLSPSAGAVDRPNPATAGTDTPVPPYEDPFGDVDISGTSDSAMATAGTDPPVPAHERPFAGVGAAGSSEPPIGADDFEFGDIEASFASYVPPPTSDPPLDGLADSLEALEDDALESEGETPFDNTRQPPPFNPPRGQTQKGFPGAEFSAPLAVGKKEVAIQGIAPTQMMFGEVDFAAVAQEGGQGPRFDQVPMEPSAPILSPAHGDAFDPAPPPMDASFDAGPQADVFSSQQEPSFPPAAPGSLPGEMEMPRGGTQRIQSSGSTNFGEIELVQESGEFSDFPVAEEASTFREEPDGSGLDLADDPRDFARAGSIVDEPIDDEEEEYEEDEEMLREGQRPAVPFEGRRRFERQSRRAQKIMLSSLVVLIVGGALLYFTPLGPFGASALYKLIPRPQLDMVVDQTFSKIHKRLETDTVKSVNSAFEELEYAKKEVPEHEDLRILGVFLHKWHQIRFGEDKAHEVEATQLLGSINLQESESKYAKLALVTQLVRASQVDEAQKVVNGFKLDKAKKADKRVVASAANALAALAVGYFKTSNFKEALATAQKLANLEKKSPRARFLLAKAQAKTGDVKSAEAVLKKLMFENSDHIESMLLLYEVSLGAKDFAKDLDIEKAKQQLNDVVKSDFMPTTNSQKARAHALLGMLNMMEQHYTKAEAEFELSQKLDPLDIVMLIGKGELALINKDPSSAAVLFARAKAKEPNNLAAILGEAETMIRQGSLKEAKTAINSVLPKNTKNPRAHYLLGWAEMLLKNTENAQLELQTSIALDQKFLEAYVTLSELYLKTKREKEAMDTLYEASDIAPNAPLIKLKLAEIFASRGEFGAAIIELDKAIEQDQNYVDAYFMMGQVYRKMGSLDDAARSFKEVEIRAPDYPGLAMEQGLLMELSGEVEKALATYELALKDKPDSMLLKVRVGVASFLLKRYQRAEVLLLEILSANPKWIEANFYLGEVYRVTDRLAEAVALLKTAVDLDSNNALYHLRLGMVYFEVHQMDRAMREFELAREIDPNMAEIYVRVGQHRLQEGSTRDAIEYFDKALELDKEFKETYELLGDSFEQLGDMKRAVHWYRLAAKADPTKAEIFFKLTLVELKVHGYRVAVNSLEVAVELAGKREKPPRWFPEALYRLGETYESLGARQKAIHVYQRYKHVAPDNHIDRREVEARLDGLLNR